MHQISKIYFVIKLYKFRASSVPIIRSYLLYARKLLSFMQVMWPLPRRVRLELQFQHDSARKRSHNLHETYQLPCVQRITHDDVHRRCPKRVEFYDKVHFGYLMHPVGCFIRVFIFCFSYVCLLSWLLSWLHFICRTLIAFTNILTLMLSIFPNESFSDLSYWMCETQKILLFASEL